MIELNRIMITGRLGRDPEVSTHVDVTIAKFSIASNRRRRDAEPETDWHNVTAFGKTAEFIEKYFSKGSAIFIEGQAREERWKDKDGNKRNRHVIIADRVQFAESKRDADSANRERASPDDNAPADDIPF